MKIELESTDEETTYKGQAVRLWQGRTEGGVGVLAFVTLVSCTRPEDMERFKTEARRTEHATRPDGSTTLFDLHGEWMLR